MTHTSNQTKEPTLVEYKIELIPIEPKTMVVKAETIEKAIGQLKSILPDWKVQSIDDKLFIDQHNKMTNYLCDKLFKTLSGSKSFSIEFDNEQDKKDFILDIVNQFRKECNVFNQDEFKQDFDSIITPAIKYLCDNHHPHTSIIVTQTTAELLEGIQSVGEVTDYLKD